MEVVKPIISGISHCCHHDVHYEWCTDYDGRVGFIKKNKPENEQALRLRLFQIVPAGKLTLICKEAAEAYRAAWEVHHEAWEAYCKALGVVDGAVVSTNDAEEAWRRAESAFLEAERAYWKVFKTCERKLGKKLHDEMFPDCTWNGKTIFSDGWEKSRVEGIGSG